MKALLICPAERPAVERLLESEPLANLPVYGKRLIEHWLIHRALQGAREVFVLATDRPEQVRRRIGDGKRWGLRVEVIPERRELTVEEARSKYRVHEQQGWLKAPEDAVLMDHLPGGPEPSMFASYAACFTAVQSWLPNVATPDRIGMRQREPGVWVGLHSRVARDVEFRPPCWVGEHVYVGPGSIIGPKAILEDRVFVERAAHITQSAVGPETFVGALTELRHSLAWGNSLINWQTGSCLQVPDPFVLSGLNARHAPRRCAGRLGRLVALSIMALTLPWGLVAILKSRISGRPAFRRCVAVRSGTSALGNRNGKLLAYYELGSASGWLRRWPQLWNVARGEFAWVGNRPLSPAQAGQLASPFEQLWLSAPIGLVSLADVMNRFDAFDDDARAHASFYAVQANRRLDWSILARVLFASRPRHPEAPDRDLSSSLVSTSLAEAEK